MTEKLKVVADSHVDHGFNEEQLNYILEKYADKAGFFTDTGWLPEELGTVPCALYGPAMEDDFIGDDEVVMERRGNREWPSRLIDKPVRQTNCYFIVAGPNDDDSGDIVLYTMYGGPEAPQEPGDPHCRDKGTSEAFWSIHALSK